MRNLGNITNKMAGVRNIKIEQLNSRVEKSSTLES